MATTDSKIEDFAEELGRLLGTAEAKARGWLGQREQIAKTLEGIRDTASKLLNDLGHQAARAVRRGRPAQKRGRGRPKGSAMIGQPKRRTMSAKARAAISAAQKARWAKLKSAKKRRS
jgi:hypothetical protein